jgi:two-component system NtrC family sensor kinase
MASELTNNTKPSGGLLDAIAANEALTLSLIRQHELTEAAELANAQLKAEIVARKKAEEALIVSAKLSSVGRMAAVISHEINNPLAAVTDLLYLAQTVAGTPGEVLEYLATADGELKRIAHITRQTLGFYREMSSPTVVHLGSLLDSVLDLLQARIRSKRAIVHKQCDDQLQIDSAIHGELRKVFSNFLVNSLDALEENGTVKLRASMSFDPRKGVPRVRITIADNGHGIAFSVLPKIFEPFFTTKGEIGNGLGLWVSKQIIGNHGGAVQVRSSTSGSRQGTSFSIVLPTGKL